MATGTTATPGTRRVLVSSDRLGRPRVTTRQRAATTLVATMAAIASLPLLGAFAGEHAHPWLLPAAIAVAALAAWAFRRLIGTLIVLSGDGVVMHGLVYRWDDIESVRIIEVDDGQAALLIAASDGRWAVTVGDEPRRVGAAYAKVGSPPPHTAPREVALLRRRAALAQWAPAAACVATTVVATVWTLTTSL
jgi:hypothetical protein